MAQLSNKTTHKTLGENYWNKSHGLWEGQQKSLLVFAAVDSSSPFWSLLEDSICFCGGIGQQAEQHNSRQGSTFPYCSFDCFKDSILGKEQQCIVVVLLTRGQHLLCSV
jgi:hypothetical protein